LLQALTGRFFRFNRYHRHPALRHGRIWQPIFLHRPNVSNTPVGSARFAPDGLLPLLQHGARMQPLLQTDCLVNQGSLPVARKPRVRGRLLVAEDSRCVQRILCALLDKIGLRPEIASNGQIACNMAEESNAAGHPYDLILMDMQMPTMNGYEAVRRLRNRGCQSPIVAVTAYDTAHDLQKCVEAGCDDYLTKPISETALRSVVQRYLQSD
jgi:CheY-like chemotaxis protein